MRRAEHAVRMLNQQAMLSESGSCCMRMVQSSWGLMSVSYANAWAKWPARVMDECWWD